MSHKIARSSNRISSNYLVISGLGLALCFGAATVSAQGNQRGQVSATPMQQGQQYPQDQRYPQGPQDPQAQGPADQDMQQQYPPNQNVPQTLTLPAGTIIRVRVNEWLSSDRNLPGDGFSAVLDQPIVVDGWVVARRGQSQAGRVSMAQKAGHAGGASKLGVELTQLTLVDGQQLPIQTKLLQTSAGTSHGADAAAIGTTSGIGAIAGAAAAGGPGAAIGAGAGAAAGIIGVLITRGRPTIIFPETVLSFTIQAPIDVSTDRSQSAFQPVSQEDYDARASYGCPQRLAGPGAPGGYPPPPPPYYYGYGYPYAYYGYPYAYGYYPVPFGFGFYGGYGPRFRGGFRR